MNSEKKFQKLHASILIADIRNFTPNLKDSESSASTHLYFCQFLANFYEACSSTCSLACDPDERHLLYLNSTGDGILSVFLSPRRHFADAYLAGILLYNKLPGLIDSYNKHKHKRVPDVSFGIGIDTGTVWRVTSSENSTTGKPFIETYIGNCINIAARVEAVTKEHDRTNLIVSENTYQELCRFLFKTDYHELMINATDDALTGSKKKSIWDQMNKLDENLLLRFISAYNLRGVSEPVRLYRLSPTLASPDRKECQKLLKDLTVDPVHLRAVKSAIE